MGGVAPLPGHPSLAGIQGLVHHRSKVQFTTRSACHVNAETSSVCFGGHCCTCGFWGRLPAWFAATARTPWLSSAAMVGSRLLAVADCAAWFLSYQRERVFSIWPGGREGRSCCQQNTSWQQNTSRSCPCACGTRHTRGRGNPLQQLCLLISAVAAKEGLLCSIRLNQGSVDWPSCSAQLHTRTQRGMLAARRSIVVVQIRDVEW